MLQNRRLLTFRPSPTPALLAPLTVRSAGYYRMEDWGEERQGRGFTQLFWIGEGRLSYERAGGTFAAAEGETFYYRQGEMHRIRVGAGKPCAYAWITFDGPFVGDWLARALPGPGPRRVGPCPVEHFRRIREAVAQASLSAEIRTAQLGLELLAEFTGTNPSPEGAQAHAAESLCARLEALLEARHTDPDFGIEEAARLLDRHRSTLFRIYREQRGITPSAYLQRLRLRRALSLLRESRLGIAEIAGASGFRDANYFAKVIRQATGESPRAIRQQG